MSCPWLETTSRYFDGDLEKAELQPLEGHLRSCGVCNAALEDFRMIRWRIRLEPSLGPAGTANLRQPGIRGIWARRVAVPVPAFAFMLALIVTLGGWLLTSLGSSSVPEPVPTPAGYTNVSSNPRAGILKFDHGERAVIYKVAKDDLRVDSR